MKIVSKESPVKFRCKMCGSCCRRLLNLEITAYDIVNWWEMGRTDIIAHLIAIQDEVAKSYGAPLIFTFPRRGDGACIYLRNNICTIHEVKPLACRIYPFGLGPNYELIIQEECPGLGDGDPVNIDEIIGMLRKHLAGIEALKMPNVLEKILNIVIQAKNEILRKYGCLEQIERIEKERPDYIILKNYADINRLVYVLYYGDIGALTLRIDDINTLSRWFAENTRSMDDAVSIVHIHEKDSENNEETCRGIVLLYSTRRPCHIEDVIKRCIDYLNDLGVELTTVFLRY